MREFLINAGMICWTLALCWMWLDVFLFREPEDNRTFAACMLTILWWIVVIWVL